MSNPTGGFESGADYVAARISIDVPTEGISNLREATEIVNRFRTAVEAAARGSASFTSYLQQMTQTAQQTNQAHQSLIETLGRTADVGQRAATGGTGGNPAQALSLSRGAPGAYVDPFSGMGGGMGGVRSPQPGDVVNQIDATRQLDPRKYLNAQTARFNTQPGDMPSSQPGQADWNRISDQVDRREKIQADQEAKTPGGGPTPSQPRQESGDSMIKRYGGLASNIMSEMSVGNSGGHLGMLNMARRGLGALSSHIAQRASAVGAGTGSETAQAALEGGAEGAEESAGTNLSGIAGTLGKAGLGLGVGVAGLAALQKGGAMYQGYKNMGLIRGGGAGEGFQDEMAIRSMALNPFLSTEQSRQIIMAGLTEGYSGKQFDTVTQFMASNLKDMNMSVSEQVQLLRKNVNEGGQSITGLAASLGVLKEMSKSSGMSLPDMKAAFEQGTNNLISSGVGGGQAAQAMLDSMGVEDQAGNPLKGQFAQMVGVSGTTMGSSAMMAVFGGNHTPGLNPAMQNFYGSQHGQDQQQMTGATLKNLVARTMGNAQPGSVEYANKLFFFMQMLGRAFPGAPAASDPNLADQWVRDIRQGLDPSKKGKEVHNEQTQKVDAPEGFMSYLGGTAGAAGNQLLDVGKELVGQLSLNPTAVANARSDFAKQGDVAQYNAHAYQNPVISSIVGQYGPGGVQVVDSQGNASPLTGSKQQVSDLTSGKLNWRRKGEEGAGIPLSQTPNDMNKDFHTTGQTNVNFSPAQVNIKVDTTTGNATVSPNPLQLTPNQQQANMGYGNASHNNEPPGYAKNSSVGMH